LNEFSDTSVEFTSTLLLQSQVLDGGIEVNAEEFFFQRRFEACRRGRNRAMDWRCSEL